MSINHSSYAALAVGSAQPAAARTIPPERLLTMSLGETLDAGIQERLRALARLPYVDSVLALPDVHQKDKMEIPSSIAIATRDVIVPEFTSVAVNDGMGVVSTGLEEDDFTPGRLEKFFTRVNAHSAENFFDMNRYSITVDEFLGVIEHGGRAVLRKYGLDESILKRMEWDGCIPVNGPGRGTFRDALPRQLVPSRFSRSEMGLNFGGNHFLEVQVVDEILDPTLAAQWGFSRGQVVVMYHLGPGPFSGTLLHHYANRTKLRGERVPLFLLSKLLFHYVQRAAEGSAARKWALHFRRNTWTPFPADSDEGTLLRRAIAMGINYGYAYRLATVRAIVDGLHEALSPKIEAGLFCDISHNGITEEWVGSDKLWVARHNACRLESGKPTIVAGSYDVPSYLGIGGDGVEDRYHSYDHGAGNLIDHYKREDRLSSAPGSVLRFAMTRGKKARTVHRKEVTMRSAEPMERLMDCLDRHRVMQRVIRLRPIANLKN